MEKGSQRQDTGNSTDAVEKTGLKKPTRRSLEEEMLRQFREMAEHRFKLSTFSGQGKKNQLELEGNFYYQFGDLRIDLPDHHLIIEVESGGGINNLAKYWYYFKEHGDKIQKKIILLHIYRLNSEKDYASHHSLWEFLWEKMKNDIDNGENIKHKINARLFKIHYNENIPVKEELDEALEYFRKTIEENLV